jgi:anti-sigma regulatory factor (Ser/Thr protein kinase)
MPPAGPCSLRRSLRPEPDAAIAARRALASLRSQIDDDLLTRSRLAVSEVVTNSVKHARLQPPQVIALEVWVLPDRLRVEVTDRGPGFHRLVARPDPDDARAGGWGLWLVDQLTDGWGVDLSHSTRVWMEFDRTTG